MAAVDMKGVILVGCLLTLPLALWVIRDSRRRGISIANPLASLFVLLAVATQSARGITHRMLGTPQWVGLILAVPLLGARWIRRRSRP